MPCQVLTPEHTFATVLGGEGDKLAGSLTGFLQLVSSSWDLVPPRGATPTLSWSANPHRHTRGSSSYEPPQW
ncbi:MAG: hypothetical protein Q8Q38_00075 [bacterium]|nr:hypothetical protein [bacterium]